MKLEVSKPLRLALVASAVGTIILVLWPEPIDISIPERTIAVKRYDAVSEKSARSDLNSTRKPWYRPVLKELELSQSAPASDAGVLPIPSMANASADPTPPLPPLPNPVDQPDVTYLGRMIKDDQTQVFFAYGGNPVVLGLGGVINSTWRIEQISAEQISLRNLQSGEVRFVAMEGNATASQGPRSVTTVQVGQRFLASAPIQHHESDIEK